MKLLFDFFPIFIFYIAFKIAGIYIATATFLIASVLQMSYQWYKHRRFEQMHIITFCLGFIFSSATLLLHNALFIKWKPTIIYWAFAIVFLFSHIFGTKPLIKRMLETNIDLPQRVWLRLNLIWMLFFFVMGMINLYVVYHFSTNAWVNFKLFGMLGLTLVFIFLQALYMNRHLIHKSEQHEAR